MIAAIQDFSATDKRIPMRELIAALQETLCRNHEKILEAARSDWQNSYGACDASDACVTVRIAKAGSRTKRGGSAGKRAMRWGC
ncbi:MAG: hypothetical protein ABR526_12975 [Chthoniobacterales bacterium]